jgi:hypothetical protein
VKAIAKYISELAKCIESSPIERLARIELDEWPSSTIELLVWIHPRVWRFAPPEDVGLADPRGTRAFTSRQGIGITNCQWSIVAGALCTLQDDITHGDHIWPYSIGGPTLGLNYAKLCSTHNMLKGAAIIELAEVDPVWLRPLRGRIRAYVTQARIGGLATYS